MKIDQGQLIVELAKYEERYPKTVKELLAARGEAALVAFAKARRAAGDEDGALLAALVATLTPAGHRAITRRIGELLA